MIYERDKETEIDSIIENEKNTDKIKMKEHFNQKDHWRHSTSMKRDSFAIRTKHNLERRRKLMNPLS